MVPLTQKEKGEWGPKSMGQNGAETHLGTIRVPIDLHTTKCLMTRGTRDTGGTSQLFSPAQSKQKASTPSESGFQKREKNLGNLRLWEWAKRSTECGPQMLSTWCKKFKRNTPVIKINDPTYGIRVPIERPRNPVHLQINTISQN